MSSILMDTEAGGEQTQYEAAATETEPHKKSGGQLGGAETTTDPCNTQESDQQASDRGERTAENIRYGQTVSEGGMGGMTKGMEGKVEEEGYGRLDDATNNWTDGAQDRVAEGYGGEKDMDKSIGG